MYIVTINQDYWTAKNQLQRDIKRQCREHVHGTMIHSKEDRSRWLSWFIRTINELSAKSKAQKPIVVEHVLRDNDHLTVYISGVVTIIIYPVLNHFVAETIDEVENP